MIQPATTPGSATHEKTGNRCRQSVQSHRLNQPVGNRYDLTQPMLSVPGIEVVSRDDRRPIPNPPATFRATLEAVLAGLFMFLTIATGLFFVVWFMLNLVMGFADFGVQDFAQAIRGN